MVACAKNPLDANISASQPYCDFQRLRNSDFWFKFIYNDMQTFFIVDLCTFSLLQQHERHRIFFGTFVKPKQGGVVRTLSLPSTVHGHNFRRQISVHKFPSTDNFRQHSYTHDTHSCLRCTRMNELKMAFQSINIFGGGGGWYTLRGRPQICGKPL